MIISSNWSIRHLCCLLTSVALSALMSSCFSKIQYVTGNDVKPVKTEIPQVVQNQVSPEIVSIAHNQVRSLPTLKDDVRYISFPRKEVRALWITTINNLDWPSQSSTPERQKSELIAIYDLCKRLNINTVVLQVRPLSDALYNSTYEPWSHVLTGTQGKDPSYDPLQFAVEEAHRRGLSIHAWINPYRIGPTSLNLSSDNIARRHPKWTVEYNGALYLNPGLPAVRDHLNDVVKDIITHYDVDAIHFDDYFYPGGIKHGSASKFNDKAAYKKYGKGKSIDEWRAQSVNSLIEEVHNTIRRYRPEVLFGISPSGRHEKSLELFADPLLWLNNRWIDYLTPQIYWEFGHEVADYGKLATFWNDNANGVPVMIGIGAYRFRDPKTVVYGNMNELRKQIDAVRNLPNLKGFFFFRAKDLTDKSIDQTVQNEFSEPALLPVMGNVDIETLRAPKVSVNGSQISWNPIAGASQYVVYRLERDTKEIGKYNAHIEKVVHETSFSTEKNGELYVVTALTNRNQESQCSDVIMVR